MSTSSFVRLSVFDHVHSASSAVLVRLAYLPGFRDPEFLYATVPIAIWSEVEISLGITAGSLPTLRPLYKVAAKKFSWKTNVFSSQKSGRISRVNFPIPDSAASRKESDYASCSESERKIVRVDQEEYVLQDQSLSTGGKFMGITQTTHIHVDLGDRGKP